MPHRLHWLQWIPIIGAIQAETLENRPMLAKIVESMAVGALSAALVLWSNDKLQDERINALKTEIQSLRHDLEQFRLDFYIPRTGPAKGGQ